jgi:hypothetical protein
MQWARILKRNVARAICVSHLPGSSPPSVLFRQNTLKIAPIMPECSTLLVCLLQLPYYAPTLICTLHTMLYTSSKGLIVQSGIRYQTVHGGRC